MYFTPGNLLCNEVYFGSTEHLAQVQMFMHRTRKNMALLCIADPNFESNIHIKIIRVKYHSTHCTNLIKKCLAFWEYRVFVELCSSYGSQS